MQLSRDEMMRLDVDYGPDGITVTFTQAAAFDQARMFDGIPEDVIARAREMSWTPLERKVFDATRSWPREDRHVVEDFMLLRRCHKLQAQDRSGQGRQSWLAQRLGRAREAEAIILCDPDDLRPRVQASPERLPGQQRARSRSR